MSHAPSCRKFTVLVALASVVSACSFLTDLSGFSGDEASGSNIRSITDAALDGSKDGALDDGALVDGSDPSTDTSPDVDVVADGSSLVGCDVPGLVAAWKFDDGAGNIAHDCTEHGFDATLMVDAAWAAGPNGGKALNFPLGSYAEVLSPAGLHFGGPFSIVTRVLYRSVASNGRIVASSLYPGNRGFELTAEKGPSGKTGRTSYLSILVPNQLPDGGLFETFTDTESFSMLTWVNLATVFDGASVKIYRDTKLEGETAIPAGSTRIVAAQPFYIGRRTDCCYMDGVIDDLRIYQRVISADEITLLANAP